MKNLRIENTYRILLLLVLVAIGFSRCDTLDEDPTSLLSSDNLDSEIKIEAAMQGIYDVWYNSVGELFVRCMLAEGPMPYTKSRISGSSGDDWTNYAWDPATTDFLFRWWNFHYSTINICNTIIEATPGNVDLETEERLIAEARFHRADQYFYLVRMYGGVPLHLETTADIPLDGTSLPRSTEEEVYAAIIEDLLYAEAEGRLPEVRTGAEVGRPTIGAAKALLGEVYLQMGGLNEQGLLSTGSDGYSLAEAKLLEVVNSGSYALQSDLESIFDVSNEWNSEIVHAYSTARDFETPTLFPWAFGPPNSPFSGGREPFVQFGFLQSYYDSFETNDVRRDWFAFEYEDRNGDSITYNTTNDGITMVFVSGYTDELTGMACIKFKDTQGEGPLLFDTDYVFIRYSDVLLMLAEAQVKNGNAGSALQHINAVRNRAGLASLTSVTLDDIKQERSWELALEFQGYFDLQRWGDVKEAFDASPAVAAAGTIWHEGLIRLPLHSSTLTANTELMQNPGYAGAQ